MINDRIIERINELARKAKSEGLTAKELDERNVLRRRYIDAFKTSLKRQLESIEFVDSPNETKGRNQ